MNEACDQKSYEIKMSYFLLALFQTELENMHENLHV